MLFTLLAADMTPATGLAIAITGMLIVFLVLVLISLALMSLPRVLAVVNEFYPEKSDAPIIRTVQSEEVDQELAAAAAVAMHLHRSRRT